MKTTPNLKTKAYIKVISLFIQDVSFCHIGTNPGQKFALSDFFLGYIIKAILAPDLKFPSYLGVGMETLKPYNLYL